MRATATTATLPYRPGPPLLCGRAGPQAAVPRPSYARLDDAALVQLVIQEDVRALEALYDRYARAVFSLAFKILADREAVEDVVQEVFMRLWRRAEGYDAEKGKLLTWLLTITHHRAVDELRRRGRHPTEGLREELALAAETEADPSDSFAHLAEREAVQQALHRLPAAQRLPIELAFYRGMTQAEIADALHAPLGTIKTRTRLGLQKLRTLLA